MEPLDIAAARTLQELTSGRHETPQPSAAFLEALKANLALFGEIYRQQLTPLAIVAYREALGDLSIEALNYGCKIGLKMCKFIPSPAEILAFAMDMPPRKDSEQTKNCPLCSGTGWRMVPRVDGQGEWAKKCDCRKPQLTGKASA